MKKDKEPREARPEKPAQPQQVTAEQIINTARAQETMILANMARRAKDNEADEKELVGLRNIIHTAEMLKPPPKEETGDNNTPA